MWTRKSNKDQSPANGANGNGAAVAVQTPATNGATRGRLGTRELVLARSEVHQQVISAMDLSSIGRLGDELRLEVRRQAEALCRRRADLLSLEEREQLVNEVLDETFGLGPLESLMRDQTVSDILINGPKSIFVERRGRLEKPTSRFTTTVTCCKS